MLLWLLKEVVLFGTLGFSQVLATKGLPSGKSASGKKDSQDAKKKKKIVIFCEQSFDILRPRFFSFGKLLNGPPSDALITQLIFGTKKKMFLVLKRNLHIKDLCTV
jgi:hypothetical protein